MGWLDQPEGSNLNNAYEQFKILYNTKLPGHHQSFLNLAQRQIKG